MIIGDEDLGHKDTKCSTCLTPPPGTYILKDNDTSFSPIKNDAHRLLHFVKMIEQDLIKSANVLHSNNMLDGRLPTTLLIIQGVNWI